MTSYSLRNTVDTSMPGAFPKRSEQYTGSSDDEIASLSQILSKAASAATRDTSFVAFKALPVDVNSQYVFMGIDSTESEQMKVTDCRQAVEFILRCILRISQEQKRGLPLVVEHKDIVR